MVMCCFAVTNKYTTESYSGEHFKQKVKVKGQDYKVNCLLPVVIVSLRGL